jgi:hypothetical protein
MERRGLYAPGGPVGMTRQAELSPLYWRLFSAASDRLAVAALVLVGGPKACGSPCEDRPHELLRSGVEPNGLSLRTRESRLLQVGRYAAFVVWS